MKKQTLCILLVPAFAAAVFLAPGLFAEGETTAAIDTSELPVSGANGFEVSIASEDVSVASGSAEAASESATLEGTIDVGSDYLNVRNSAWGTIIGRLNTKDKVKIVCKDGDWFKIDNGADKPEAERYSYIHSYYVDAPGYPSHQGEEPPVLGSDQSPAAPNPGAGATVDNGTFGADPCDPMPDSVSSDYGPRDIGIGSSYHEGIDLPVGNGTCLNALGNGTVIGSGWADGGGNYVEIQYDNGYSSLYYHLESTTVSEGQRVSIGQNVGFSDNTGAWTTGPHLHMGIFDNSGSSVNPRDVPGLEFPPLVE